MAKLIEAKEQKQWVRRDSKAYHELKKKYGPATTFPIVFRKGKWIGGYSEFITLTLKP